MKVILDTNVISELISKNPDLEVLSFINSLEESDIFLSVITIGEIQSGIQKLPNSHKKTTLLDWLHTDLFSRFDGRIVSIDTDIMLTWGEIDQTMKTKGTPMPIMDSLIGATCVSKGFTLITRNEKDFKSLEISIINPFLR